MQQQSDPTFGRPVFAGLMVGFAAVFLVASLARMIDRDIWMDEAWSLFLSDPLVDSLSLIRQRLSVDMHPPFFNLVLHAFREVTPAGLTVARSLNVLACLPAIGYFWWVWRNDAGQRPTLACYLLLLSTGFFFVHFGAEARVYWSLILASACYALAVVRVMPALIEGGSPTAVDWWVLWAASALLLHLHVYSAIFVTLHAGIDLLLMAAYGRWRHAAGYLLWMLVFGLLLVWWYATQTLFLKGMDLGGGWIQQLPLGRAMRRVAGFAVYVVPNMVALLFAIAALPSLLLSRGTQGDRSARLLSRAEQTCLLGMAGALVMFSMGIIVGNLFSPLIVDRYFTVITGPLCVLVAWLSVRRIARLQPRWRAEAALGLIVAGIAAFAFQLMREPNYWNLGLYWGKSARYALSAHGSCPQPIMHAASNRTHYVENEYIALTWGAQEMGRQMGFSTRRADPGTVLRVSPQCPVALWVLLVQQGADRATVVEILDELKLRVEGASVDELELVPFDSEAVIRLRR